MTLKTLIAGLVQESLQVAVSLGIGNDFSPGWALLSGMTVTIALFTLDGVQRPHEKLSLFERESCWRALDLGVDLDCTQGLPQPPSYASRRPYRKIFDKGYRELMTRGLSGCVVLGLLCLSSAWLMLMCGQDRRSMCLIHLCRINKLIIIRVMLRTVTTLWAL